MNSSRPFQATQVIPLTDSSNEASQQEMLSKEAMSSTSIEPGLINFEHLIAKTTLEIAENNAPLEHNTELNSLQPFGELFGVWAAFCADVDFDSDIWSFKISKGMQIGPDLKLAEKDIFGYAVVQNKKIVNAFIY